MIIIPFADLDHWVGRQTGVSHWLPVDQDLVDRFANTTGDRQFIHVDPGKAKQTALGGTIAHGFLTLALLSGFAGQGSLGIAGEKMELNYGFDRLRFLEPVPTGSRIRARFQLKSYRQKSPTRLLLTYEVTVEIESNDTPALVADWLILKEVGTDGSSPD